MPQRDLKSSISLLRCMGMFESSYIVSTRRFCWPVSGLTDKLSKIKSICLNSGSEDLITVSESETKHIRIVFENVLKFTLLLKYLTPLPRVNLH